jgi:DNA-binding NtrC family response regulator
MSAEHPKGTGTGGTWGQRPDDYVRDRLASKPIAPGVGADRTVLVADDDRTVRNAVASALRRAGFRVLEAASGLEAAQTAEREPGPIHCLLADVVMPSLTIEELSQRVCAARPGIAVMFMSGYIHDEQVRKQVLQGDATFIEKPFAMGDLVSSLCARLAPHPN